jgi:peroxiredoxin
MASQEKPGASKARFITGISLHRASPEIHPMMERATAELIASGQAARAVKAGDRAPRFTLDDQNGKPVSSADLLAQGPLVVTFYRGAWCSHCNAELQAIDAVLPRIRTHGANVVAISPQTWVQSRELVRANRLRFAILSDIEGRTSAAFRLRFTLPRYLVELYERMEIDLPLFNDDPAWTLPMPARYVIGRDGIVLYSEVNPDYTRRPDPADMLAVLEKVGARS